MPYFLRGIRFRTVKLRCLRYFLSLENILIQQKIINIDREYPVFVIRCRNDIFCYDDFLERILDFSERTDLLRFLFTVGNGICGLNIVP